MTRVLRCSTGSSCSAANELDMLMTLIAVAYNCIQNSIQLHKGSQRTTYSVRQPRWTQIITNYSLFPYYGVVLIYRAYVHTYSSIPFDYQVIDLLWGILI